MVNSFKRLSYWYVRWFHKTRHVAILLGCGITISVVLTYSAAMQRNNIFNPHPGVSLSLVLLDLLLLLALVGVIVRRLVTLVVERRKGVVGSLLQTRIVRMFSLVAIVPTVMMAIFAAAFFNLGIQAWFDKKVNAAIEGSVNVAQSYLEDHKNNIKADIRSLAGDISRSALLLQGNNKLFNQVVSGLAGGSLSTVAVFTRDHVIAASDVGFSLETNVPSEEELRLADLGEIVIVKEKSVHQVRALVQLDNFLNTYLLVGRLVDVDIINYVELTKGAAHQYRFLKDNISTLQIKFFIIFIIVSLLLLLVVVWFGLMFAVDLVKPISALLTATEKVKAGDLSIRVSEGHENDEIAALGRAFNRMIKQLHNQRVELIAAQRWAAWSDVARRIAHEIKNPLTPIQLASERLRRKFTDQVQDRVMFEKYLNTISNNVADIGHMVEEFANFARLPTPIFKDYDICSLLQDIVFSRQAISKNTKIEAEIVPKSLILHGDSSQMTRAFVNLLKNSEEAIEESYRETGVPEKGLIRVKLTHDNDTCRIQIIDNGHGFDEKMIERITEPYVTTKSKGTGLGLSIVKKIIEDHNGTVSFTNYSDNGACVTVDFYVNQ